jgi:hypothetical protein
MLKLLPVLGKKKKFPAAGGGHGKPFYVCLRRLGAGYPHVTDDGLEYNIKLEIGIPDRLANP